MPQNQRKQPSFIIVTHIPQNFFAATPNLSVVTCIENVASLDLFEWMQEQDAILFYGGDILHRWLMYRSGVFLAAQDGSYQLHPDDTVFMVYTGKTDLSPQKTLTALWKEVR